MSCDKNLVSQIKQNYKMTSTDLCLESGSERTIKIKKEKTSSLRHVCEKKYWL